MDVGRERRKFTAAQHRQALIARKPFNWLFKEFIKYFPRQPKCGCGARDTINTRAS